ncbi:hypothetical protein PPUJ20188_36580 [Pseudomonas putida]|nr:hypothetical protein PPUJ20188_36580 [Pseudomonas putida]
MALEIKKYGAAPVETYHACSFTPQVRLRGMQHFALSSKAAGAEISALAAY